jgi:hypothetical protein
MLSDDVHAQISFLTHVFKLKAMHSAGKEGFNSVGIVRLQTQAMEFDFFVCIQI